MVDIAASRQLATAGVLERVQGALPDAVDPAWLEATSTGVHGSRGLRSQVQQASSTLRVGAVSFEGKATAAGSVQDAGLDVGRFRRRVKVEPNGRLNTYHALVRPDPHLDARAVARSLDERTLRGDVRLQTDAPATRLSRVVGSEPEVALPASARVVGADAEELGRLRLGPGFDEEGRAAAQVVPDVQDAAIGADVRRAAETAARDLGVTHVL